MTSRPATTTTTRRKRARDDNDNANAANQPVETIAAFDNMPVLDGAATQVEAKKKRTSERL
jgi:hypothetical protein